MAWAWARRAAAFPRERPVVFGCVFSALKTAFADYLVQRHFEDRKELDLRRTAVFTLFGFGYLGGWQYFLYVKCFPRWFPAAAPFASKSIPDKLVDRAGQLAVAKQVATEALIHAPMLYFPCFYVLKESVETGNPSNAVAKLQINLRKDLVEYWKVWIPAFVINFSLMPMWGRIPFVASVSLGWTMLLSSLRGAPQHVDLSMAPADMP